MLPQSYEPAAAILLVIGGVVACFAGYRLFRTVLGMDARPIQDLKGRVVYEFIEPGSTPAPGPAA